MGNSCPHLNNDVAMEKCDTLNVDYPGKYGEDIIREICTTKKYTKCQERLAYSKRH